MLRPGAAAPLPVTHPAILAHLEASVKRPEFRLTRLAAELQLSESILISFFAKYHNARILLHTNQATEFTQRDVLTLCDLYSVWRSVRLCQADGSVCRDPRVCGQIAAALKSTLLNVFRDAANEVTGAAVSGVYEHEGTMICKCSHNHNHPGSTVLKRRVLMYGYESPPLMEDEGTLDGYYHGRTCSWSCCDRHWSHSHPVAKLCAPLLATLVDFLRAHVRQLNIVEPLVNAVAVLTSSHPECHEQLVGAGILALITAVLHAHEGNALFVGDAVRALNDLSASSLTAAAACERAGAPLALMRVLACTGAIPREEVVRALVCITCSLRAQNETN
jgi:hypothetical protein